MKMTLSEVFDVVLKGLQEVLVQGQVSAKDEGPWRDVPPVKSFLHCLFFKYGFQMGHFILVYIVETQKFHLEHCKIKADFTLNVLLVHISVLWECFMCKMLDHIALLRAINKKKRKRKEKKNLFPTDRPYHEKGIYGQANYFFSWPNAMGRWLYWPSGMEVCYCTFGFGAIIRHDLRTLPHDLPRSDLYACVI